MKTQEGPWDITYGIGDRPARINGNPVAAVISGPELASEYATACGILPIGQEFAITVTSDNTFPAFLILTPHKDTGDPQVASHYHDYPSYAAALFGACDFAVNDGN